MTQHIIPATDLRDGHRIFIMKNLRILTVTGRPQIANGQLTIKYNELAAKSYDSLVVDLEQKVRILCDGWCSIDRDLDSLI